MFSGKLCLSICTANVERVKSSTWSFITAFAYSARIFLLRLDDDHRVVVTTFGIAASVNSVTLYLLHAYFVMQWICGCCNAAEVFRLCSTSSREEWMIAFDWWLPHGRVEVSVCIACDDDYCVCGKYCKRLYFYCWVIWLSSNVANARVGNSYEWRVLLLCNYRDCQFL